MDFYPCWIPCPDHIPARGNKQPPKYSINDRFLNAFPEVRKLYHGYPPKTQKNRKNPFENYTFYGSEQETEHIPCDQDFKVLGIKRSASDEDIKTAYRKKARIFHPDKPSGSHNLFIGLKRAYDAIMGNIIFN